MVPYSRILVFAAHPDDEIVMAGTIRKLADAGVEVWLCVSTDGCEGYPHPEWEGEIVRMRAAEQRAADEVLGVTRRHQIASPDMGLVNDKATLLRFIAIIRQARPEAIFTHGPDDVHRDHVATSQISVEAAFHAGEPVARALGEPWKTPHLFYHKGVARRRAQVRYDCTGYAHVRWLAWATQESQHLLIGRSRDEFEKLARDAQRRNEPYFESFWLGEAMTLDQFPPLPLA